MTTADPRFDALDQFVQDGMQRNRVPGVAVGVWHEGREHTAGFGVTNINHPLPVNADTLFQVGSITKTFTATTMLRLSDMGKLNLDAPVRTYMPELRLRDEDAAARVTVRELFTHRGGWLGDYFDDTGNGDDALARYVAAMVNLPQIAPLGAIFSYNNAALAVAGRVIEKVTGQTYEHALTDLILKPLNLPMSFIFPTDVMTNRFVAGHFVTEDKVIVAKPWPLARSAAAVGGLISTVKDQLRYARFHMCDGLAEDGTRIISAGAVKGMQAHMGDGPLGEYMGLGWFVRAVDGVHTVRHTGGTVGHLTLCLFVPERNFALSVLTNADRGTVVYREAAKWALDKFLGIVEPAPVHQQLSDSQRAEYVGRYTSAMTDYAIFLNDDQMVLQATPKGGFPYKDSPPAPTPPPTRIAFTGEDRIVALDPPSQDVAGEFLRDENGALAWLRLGSRICRREA